MSDDEQGRIPHFHREGDAVVFDPPENEKETARRRREDEQHEFARQQVKTNKRIALFTGVLVVATIVGSGISIWQATIAQLSAKAAQDAASAAQTQADASTAAVDLQEIQMRRNRIAEGRQEWLQNESLQQSKTSLQATIDQFHLQQRAWIAVTSVHGNSFTADDFEIDVEITNTGPTPAHNVVVYPSFIFADPNYIVPLNDDVPANRLGLLSPRGDRTINWTKRGDAFLANSNSDVFKTRRVTIFGKVSYDDEFGCHHWVTYCARSSNDWTKYRFCESHNDVDVTRDCENGQQK